MPTYEYACKSCGEHLEVVQSFRDDPLSTCPHCAGALRKVFGAIGIAFKGSGFYKTDSRDSSGKPKAKPKDDSKPAASVSSSSSDGGKGKDSGSGSDSGSKGSAKGDTKAAASS